PGWGALATVVALVEAGLLAWLWFGPVMAVRAVEVVGARHMTSSQVAHAAGLQGSASIISIDGLSAQQRLLNQVWVRTASVQPQVPGTVVVQGSEWHPIAAYHAGRATRLYLLCSQAGVLGATTTAVGRVVIRRAGGQDDALA